MGFEHPKAATNNCVSTSNEFAQIIGFLEGKNSSQAEGLRAMRNSGFKLEFVVRGQSEYYVIDDNDAWEYLSKRYKYMLEKKRISSMERLKYEANEYAENRPR